MPNLSERIKELRKSANMTQEEFGQKFGIVKSTVSLYENGKSTPNDEIKSKICEYFKVSLDYLHGRTNIKRNPEQAFTISNIRSEKKTKEDQCFVTFFYFDTQQTDRLKNLLKQYNTSEELLSSQIKVPTDEIYNLLNGGETHLEIVLNIASFFNVSMDYLLCRTDYEAVIAPESEVADLLSYYYSLDKTDRRWIMGQIINLLKEKNDISEPKSNSTVSDKSLKRTGTDNMGK